VPRPQPGVSVPDVGPGDALPPLAFTGFRGHKRESETLFTIVRFRPEKRDSPHLAN
jgi:hypothetical protein